MNTQIQPVNGSAPALRGNQHWPALREAGKIDRLNFTDAIASFNEYVDGEGEGATRPDLAYSNFTRSVYAPFGLNKAQREAVMAGESKDRDLFDVVELRYLQMAESAAAMILHQGIEAGATRKSIKVAVRDECGRIAGMYRRITSGVFGGGKSK
ncbi:MAG: hypothetical protein ABNH26_08700 [Celeribacter sp.]|jgi:hypothetical protein